MKHHQQHWLTAAVVSFTVLALTACSGPQGDRGPAGPDGIAGAAGAAGSQGVAGATGLVGATGATGATGSTGAAGGDCTVTAFDGGVTVTCPGSNPVTIYNGTNANDVLDFTALSANEVAALDLAVTVSSVTDAAKPAATFTVIDKLKGKGVKNIPPAYFNGISLLKLEPGNTAAGGNGLGNDTWVSYLAKCSACAASSETANATTLQDQKNGTYVYTFAKDVQTGAGATYSATATTRFGLRLYASGNAFAPVNVSYDYIPATGANVTGDNEKVSGASCLECHGQFRANALNAGGTMAFHSGARYLVPYCHVCHNDQRRYQNLSDGGSGLRPEPSIELDGGHGYMTPDAGTSIAIIRGEAFINLPVFIHKIHRGEHLFLKGPYSGLGEEVNEIFYPQDIRNCTKCHKDATLADNWKNKPSRRACGSCHDKVDFAATVGPTKHTGDAQANDNMCANCHNAAAIAGYHVPVIDPDPNSTLGGGTNKRTNAGWLGNPSSPPAGANVITFSISSVSTVAVTGGSNAAVKFKFLKDGTGVTFNVYDGGSPELMADFVGGPAVYCAYAVPQDGLTAPADFNQTASANLEAIFDGSKGTLTGPDSSGLYTATLTGTVIPDTAKMLTCGLGYAYDLPSSYVLSDGGVPIANQPLTQTNVTGYPFNSTTGTGGLILPVPNVWKVATGYTGRRGATATSSQTGQIVNAAKCNSCHAPLGVAPSFHVGQRNDGPTCSFCHTPNRTSSAWTAGSGFIHAIHAAGMRAVPYNWHATSATTGFYQVTYPGRPQMCEQCHNAGYFDFSASWYTTGGGANVGNLLYQTVAQGTYAASDSLSPYVTIGTSYGSGFSASTGLAGETTQVISPITATCVSCHDGSDAVSHMKANGGSFYADRGAPRGMTGADGALRVTEQCLLCHGPGKIAAIKDIHYR